jgi:hypothetical protein
MALVTTAASENDRRIAEHEVRLERIRAELDVITAAYRRVTTTWLVAWYEEETTGAITADPDFTGAVPDEQLAAMRAEVLEVIGEAGATVDAVLGDEVWPHHASDEEILAEGRECTRLPEAIDRGHRRAMGRLGSILVAHGFARVATAAVSGLAASDWTAADGGHLEYPFAITLSDDAKAAFVAFCRSWTMLHDAVAEMASYEQARTRSAVIDRWEQLDA